MQTDKPTNTVPVEAATTSNFIPNSLVITDDLQETTDDNDIQLFGPGDSSCLFPLVEKNMLMSDKKPTSSAIPSCLKRPSDSTDCHSLPSRLEPRVRFNNELDSRWANGSPKCPKPLSPIQRSISK
ncbi:unnamed protein product [Cylindrotheca closterium]|uniref:Uncharacterized protein n=1 Tax=Cylindrotheca closterium TaxID=2856 RepID=A0AAD2GE56_9STRA|nr:unnamed protein product [Cylindrotheca closterium]